MDSMKSFMILMWNQTHYNPGKDELGNASKIIGWSGLGPMRAKLMARKKVCLHLLPGQYQTIGLLGLANTDIGTFGCPADTNFLFSAQNPQLCLFGLHNTHIQTFGSGSLGTQRTVRPLQNV